MKRLNPHSLPLYTSPSHIVLGLLISRQIIGNLRESVFPYFMEQLKLAKLSFVMWGALSPTQETKPIVDGDGGDGNASTDPKVNPIT